jgi:hypothetical protein
MNLKVLPGKYSIYKFSNENTVPEWIYLSDFYSITKTMDELSVVALQNDLTSEGITCNRDWRILKVVGPLDFTIIGIIADISTILKDSKISIFTISTYDTDYILVKEKDLNTGIRALRKKQYGVSIENSKHTGN